MRDCIAAYGVDGGGAGTTMTHPPETECLIRSQLRSSVGAYTPLRRCVVHLPETDQTLSDREARAHDQRPAHDRHRRPQDVETQAHEGVPAERDEIQDAVVAPQPAPAEPPPVVTRVRIHHVLCERRCHQHRQNPWKHATGDPTRQAAHDEKTVSGVIEGPAERAGRA